MKAVKKMMGEAEAEEMIRVRVKQATKEFEQLKENVANFERESGIVIPQGWCHKRIGAGVQAYLENPEQFTTKLARHRVTLLDMLKDINAALGDANKAADTSTGEVPRSFKYYGQGN